MSEELDFNQARQSEKVKRFLIRLREVEKEFGLSLGYEDPGGSFIVSSGFDAENEWLLCANDETNRALPSPAISPAWMKRLGNG